MKKTPNSISIFHHSKEAVVLLNQCLERVIAWMMANKLRLIPHKMEVLFMESSSVLRGYYTARLALVAFTPKVSNLGVLLDLGLLLDV